MPLNRECPKCGEPGAKVHHNRVLNEMQLDCAVCKYEWKLKPLDVLRAESEKVRAERYSRKETVPALEYDKGAEAMGYMAREAGKRVADCPWREETHLGRSWVHGWFLADDKLTAAETGPTLSTRMREAGFKSQRAAIPPDEEEDIWANCDHMTQVPRGLQDREGCDD